MTASVWSRLGAGGGIHARAGEKFSGNYEGPLSEVLKVKAGRGCFNCFSAGHRIDSCRDPPCCLLCFRSGHRAHCCKAPTASASPAAIAPQHRLLPPRQFSRQRRHHLHRHRHRHRPLLLLCHRRVPAPAVSLCLPPSRRPLHRSRRRGAWSPTFLSSARMHRINGWTTFTLGWHGLMKADTWSGA
jgi:hypothetical protein